MSFIVATNGAASQPPECWPTGTPHARANNNSNINNIINNKNNKNLQDNKYTYSNNKTTLMGCDTIEINIVLYTPERFVAPLKDNIKKI